MANADDPLVMNVCGHVGHLHLNRPKALNALSLEIIKKVTQCLDDWSNDKAIEWVLITGAGDRAFCAGVDIKSLYEAGPNRDLADEFQGRGLEGRLAADLFRAEYTLDHLVATFPKPYVAFWDGVVMGGGVGISVMGSHRIASDRTRFAMPETGIGLFPDAGASYFFSRLGKIGQLLGMTGLIIDGAATIDLGLATHYVSYQEPASIVNALLTQELDETLASFATQPRVSDDWKMLCELAEQCFGLEDLVETLDALASVEKSGSPLSAVAAMVGKRLMERSPFSLLLTAELLERGAQMSLEQCLRMEYRACQVCLQRDDFFEGVRAVLIDKDQSHSWNPGRIDLIEQSAIESCFQSLGPRDLML